MHWYVLAHLARTLERSHGGGLYDAAVSGTAMPATLYLPQVFLRRMECMIPRPLARPLQLSLYSLPPHVIVCWYVSDPRAISFKKGHGVELKNTAVSSSPLSALPPPLG